MAADTIRIATFDVELEAKGPGIMLRDILRGAPKVTAVSQVIAHIAPDIIVLQGVDYDLEWRGARALQDQITASGHHFAHIYSRRPNTGIPTNIDLNGDGRTGHAADAQGFGRFSGQSGMVILSRWPIQNENVQDFSSLLWRDAPQAQLPFWNDRAFPSKDAHRIQRLSSVGHWVVPVTLPNGLDLTLMVFKATAPVFDGPEDRNGLRNADEISLWQHLLDGRLGSPVSEPFAIMGNANLDPNKGEGLRNRIRHLLNDSRMQDPRPSSRGSHVETVDWPDPKPGDMRVDYVLPSADLDVIRAGVFWPSADDPKHALLFHKGTLSSRHRLVWVDIAF